MDAEYWKYSKEKYHKYLLSDEWKEKRNKRLEIDQYRCQMCGGKGGTLSPLQAHHFDYHHIYNENVDTDLVTLCRPCHMALHNVMNRITDSKTGRRGWKDTLSVSTVSYELNLKQLAQSNIQ